MSSLLHQRLKASPRASTITHLVHLNSPSQWLEHICALQGAWHLVPIPSLKAWGSGKNNAMLVLPLSHGAALQPGCSSPVLVAALASCPAWACRV